MEKIAIIKTPTIAYTSTLGGLEVKAISDESIIFVTGAWCSSPSAHQRKIYYNGHGVPYFKIAGLRVRFDELIRC